MPHSLFARLAEKHPSPRAVQRFLRRLRYNREEDSETLRSALGAARAREAHCLEATFVAAAVLELRGYPPLVMSLESQDDLDHVIYVFEGPRGWGSIARSRDEGLHGRAPVFKNLRALAQSYVDPYVDKSGRITGWGVAHLDDSKAPWRDSTRNVWKAERYLIDLKHQRLKMPESRYRRMLALYQASGARNTQHWCRSPHWW